MCHSKQRRMAGWRYWRKAGGSRENTASYIGVENVAGRQYGRPREKRNGEVEIQESVLAIVK